MSTISGPLVLYVEDEPMILELGVAALQDAGFVVEPAICGSAAVAVIDGRGKELRAIVTDVDLGGGLSGWDVARHARERLPDIPVVYVSGGSSHEWPSLGVPGSLILAKPYAAAQLVVAVSTLMLPPEGTSH